MEMNEIVEKSIEWGLIGTAILVLINFIFF
jgi:hypothetical protein